MQTSSEQPQTTTPPFSQDAALVAALAGTAMPFAHCAEDQAESWLRALRGYGAVGASLRALGVGEKPLLSGSAPEGEVAGSPLPEGDVLDRVMTAAGEFVVARGGESLGTGDILFALFEVYGKAMDRALFMRGTSRAELFGQMALDQHHARID